MKYLLLFTCFLFRLSVNGQNEYLDAEREREQRIQKYQDSIYSGRLDSLDKYKKALFDKTLPNCIYINSSKVVESYISSGFEIEFINTYKKKIKYVTFNVQAYNAVDDKVDAIKSKKFVGPILKNDIFFASSEDIWFNSHETIEYFNITSITLQFIDNTIQKIVNYKTTTDDMKFYLINCKLYSALYDIPR